MISEEHYLLINPQSCHYVQCFFGCKQGYSYLETERYRLMDRNFVDLFYLRLTSDRILVKPFPKYIGWMFSSRILTQRFPVSTKRDDVEKVNSIS